MAVVGLHGIMGWCAVDGISNCSLRIPANTRCKGARTQACLKLDYSGTDDSFSPTWLQANSSHGAWSYSCYIPISSEYEGHSRGACFVVNFGGSLTFNCRHAWGWFVYTAYRDDAQDYTCT